MNSLKPSLLNAKLNAMLASSGGQSHATATMPTGHTITPAKGGVENSGKNSTEAPVNSTTRRDMFLDKLPSAQQVEILRWAEQQNIKPDEALWLLVDLLGYTKFMTDTLPSRMHAAGQQAVDAIAQQRRAEADAFSDNAQKALRHMLEGITAQVVKDSKNITSIRLQKELWRYGLLVAGGVLALSAMSFAFGSLFGNVHSPWMENSQSNQLIHIAQVILGIPVGYLILPLGMTATVLMLINEIALWRRQRQLDRANNY